MKRLLTCFLLISLCLCSGCSAFQPEDDVQISYQEPCKFQTPVKNPVFPVHAFSHNLAVIPVSKKESGQNFETAFVINETTSEVLYQYNPHERLYPASITKIMTALLVLETCQLDDEVSLLSDVEIEDEQAVILGLKAGYTITVKDLLYSMLLMSANDSAIVLGRYVAGGDQEFVEMMNQRAKELGATNTHFVNPNGLHSDEQYTTAYDLYLIFRELLKHDEFLEIQAASEYDVRYTTQEDEVFYFPAITTNLFKTGDFDLPENFCYVGGKTGTTDEAGYCLILCTKNSKDEEIISCITKASSRGSLYKEMKTLLSDNP